MAKKLKHVGNGGAIVVGDKVADRLISTHNWALYGDEPAKTPEVDAEPLNEHPQGEDTPEPIEEPQKASQRPSIAEVRTWAKENNVPVSDKGRVAESVYDQYAEAHKN